MPLPLTTAEDLQHHFSILGIQAGQNVVVHSRLLSFGNIEGGLDTLYAALCGAVGAQGTIAVPAYTVALDEQTCFDPEITPSQGVGVFSEYVRKLGGAVRSRCPMHSHAAIGPMASVLSQPTGQFSLGSGSDFEALLQADFYLLLLGCTFKEGASFIHQSEVEAGVPYRAAMDLPRKVKARDGTVQHISLRYFGRPTTKYCENFDLILKYLEERRVLRTAKAPLGNSYYISLKDLHLATLDVLSSNPYALVYEGYNPYTIDVYRDAGVKPQTGEETAD